MTNDIHLTLTEWKPIPYIFPIRTTVRIGQRTKMIGSPRTRKLGKKILQKTKKRGKKQIFTSEETRDGKNCCDSAQTDKRATGTVGEGAAGKKAKATQHAGGTSLRNQRVTHNISFVRSHADIKEK